MHFIYLDEAGNTGNNLKDRTRSLPLQLCDLCTYAVRRLEEQQAGMPVKPLDQTLIPWIRPLIHRGKEPLPDVLAWLESRQKKERPGS